MPAKGLIAVLLLLLSMDLAAQQTPPAAAPSQPAPEQANTVLTLDAVVGEVRAHNPEVASAAHMVSAQRRKVSQARALPDPAVTVGWMGNATPFSVQRGDPSSYRSVGAMQMLPFPGKLRLKGEIAGKDVQAAAADRDAVSRKVVSQAKAAFFDYFYYGKALRIAYKDKDLLQKLSQIAEARYRVGKGMQQDVLKSQTEISLLLQKITVLEQQRATAQSRLNALMARPLESPLPPAAEAALTPTFRPLPELYQMAEKNSPMLQRDQRMIERGELAVAAAQKEYRPDISVGFMYQQRPDMPDMKGMTFTVNVPVFYRGKQRQGVQQAEEEVIAAQKGRENRVNETRFELKQAYLSAKAAKDLADLYSKAVVPQASLALESSMSAYQVGSSDFLTVFSNFSTLLNYEMDYYRQVADYNMAVAQLENAMGADLDTVSADPADSPSRPAQDSQVHITAAAITLQPAPEQPMPAAANDAQKVKR